VNARTLTPLGIFGLYVAGHVYCRDKRWNTTRGYVPKDESTVEPGFKFEEVGDLSAKLRAHLSQT
jgi:hypothetical protein